MEVFYDVLMQDEGRQFVMRPLLNYTGFNLDPVFCGGNKDLWIMEREQWHSGANFFAIAPGKRWIAGVVRNASCRSSSASFFGSSVPTRCFRT